MSSLIGIDPLSKDLIPEADWAEDFAAELETSPGVVEDDDLSDVTAARLLLKGQNSHDVIELTLDGGELAISSNIIRVRVDKAVVATWTADTYDMRVVLTRAAGVDEPFLMGVRRVLEAF